MSIPPQYQRACSALCIAEAGARAALMQPLSNRDQEHHLYKAMDSEKAMDLEKAMYRKSNGLSCPTREKL